MLVLINPLNANAITSQAKAPNFEKIQISKKLPKDMSGVHQFFKENNFGIEDSVNELAELKSSDDSLGYTHIKTQQMVKGIPVYGNEYIVHFNQNDEVYAINGKYDATAKDTKINKGHFIGEIKALNIAKAQVIFDELEIAPTTKLYLYNINDKYIPVYMVTLSFLYPTPGNWQIFVNAETGTIVKAINKIANIATTGTGLGVLNDTKSLNLDMVTVKRATQYQLKDTTKAAIIATYTASNAPRTPGSIVYSTTSTINDKAAVDAHYYAGVVYDYYNSKFNRNSLDGHGVGIKSTVHYSRNYVNAFWNGSQMVYGDGDGVQSLALSGALDVVAHEMTHAVDALRDMASPAKYGDPDHMSNFVVLPNTQAGDWGGVHTNSGIPNKACFLIASNSNVGIIKAEQVYYRALGNYLISTSNFHDARVALVQSATDLYGASGSEVAAINAAWDAVGVY